MATLVARASGGSTGVPGYGPLTAISAHHLSLQKIAPHWDDMLRLAGSLKLGRVPATGIMRTLQGRRRLTRLAQAIAEFGASTRRCTRSPTSTTKPNAAER